MSRIVQYVMSKAKTSTAQLDLLEATQYYLTVTCKVPFGIIGSE